MGFYISLFAFFAGFAIIWQIIWLFALGLIGAIACVIALSFDDEMEFVLPAEKVAEMEKVYAQD